MTDQNSGYERIDVDGLARLAQDKAIERATSAERRPDQTGAWVSFYSLLVICVCFILFHFLHLGSSPEPTAANADAAAERAIERSLNDTGAKDSSQTLESSPSISPSHPTPRPRDANEFGDHGLIVLEKTIKIKDGEFGIQSISGIVENRTGQDVGYAEVTFSLADKSGAQIGTAMDNIRHLKAGGRWRFKAGPLPDEECTYQLASVDGD